MNTQYLYTKQRWSKQQIAVYLGVTYQWRFEQQYGQEERKP